MLIYLEKQESLYSIIKRLQKAKAETIDLVTPEYASLSKNSLNLKIIKEIAKKAEKKIHLITTDEIVTKLAKKEGIKVADKPFSKESVHWENYQEEQAGSEPPSINPEKVVDKIEVTPEENKLTEVKGKVISVEKADGESQEKEITETKVERETLTLEVKSGKPKRYKKAHTFAKVALIFIVICFVFLLGLASFIYFVLPKATVDIILAGKDLSAEVQVTADTGAIDVNQEQKTIPGAVVIVEETGVKSVLATGKKEIGEKASGEITIQNFTDTEILFPAATIFSVYQGQTGQGLTFSSDKGVTAPAGTETIEEDSEGNPQKIITPGTVSVAVKANEYGNKYNLAGKTSFMVGSEAYTSFRGVNNNAFGGGSSQQVSIVAQADHTNLFNELNSELIAKAEDDLSSKLVGDQKMIKKTISHKVISQVYDKGVNEQTDKVSLTLKIESRATFYSESQLKQVVKGSIFSQVPAGYFFAEEDLIVTPELAKSEDSGNLVFLAKVKTTVYPILDEAELKRVIKGLRPKEAESYLKGMDKVLGYKISIWPPLPYRIRRLPFLDSRLEIQTTIKGE